MWRRAPGAFNIGQEPPISSLAQIGAGCFGLNASNLNTAKKIMREIEDILDDLSAQTSIAHFCGRCGSEMLYIDAAFFLIEGTQGWNVRLPVCPQCDEGGKDPRLFRSKRRDAA